MHALMPSVSVVILVYLSVILFHLPSLIHLLVHFNRGLSFSGKMYPSSGGIEYVNYSVCTP